MRNLNELVVYQIYPKSFQDSDGDGIGDINGIRERLTYLKELGIDIIWLTPIYPSGGRDNGYDISNYYDIDPVYGTLSDFKNLIAEAREYNIGIMLDMVLNHTSTDHPWFKEAISGNQEFMDYYIFKDEKTNWESKFGGTAWEYVPALKKYYLHLFDVKQADLNWDNPKVREEMQNIVNFWLRLGVEGLRFDVINLISKPAVYKDSLGDGREYYTDGPNVHQYLQELNKATFGGHDIVTVGELSSTSIEQACVYADPKNHELSTVFGFHHLKIDYFQNQKWEYQKPDYNQLKNILKEWQAGMQSHEATMALFWCNHDQPRIISRFGDDMNYPYESATVFATMMHLLKGMPYIYQGEEIGMPNAYFKEISNYRDVETLNYYKILSKKYDEKTLNEIIGERSRDNSRTPIVWDKTENYGFTSGVPWISFSQHPSLRSMTEDLKSKKSVYKWYQKLISLRHTETIISQGTIEWIESEDASFHFKRIENNRIWLVLNNLDGEKKEFKFDGKYSVIMSNYNRKTVSDSIMLEAYETIILEKGSN